MKSGEELASFCSLSVIIDTKCYQNMKSFKKTSSIYIKKFLNLAFKHLRSVENSKNFSYTDKENYSNVKGICDQSENLLH